MDNSSMINSNLYYVEKKGSVLFYGRDESNSKYYAIAVKCGHCGSGYFVPIILPICARDMDNAIEIAKNTGRVKRDLKDCVLGAIEIDWIEYCLLEMYNNNDYYITARNHRDVYTSHVENRRILGKETLELGPKYFKNNSNIIRDEYDVKTADMFRPDQVLQRYFAPIYYGKKLVYPKHVNMRNLLEDYHYYSTKKLGMGKKKAVILSLYLEMYGEDNALGIGYSNGKMNFVNESGEFKEVELNPRSAVLVEKFLSEHKKDENLIVEGISSEETEDTIYKSLTPIEKFKKRLEKSNALRQTTVQTSDEDNDETTK